MLILTGHEVLSLLSGREELLLETVGRAYAAHGRGESSLPHSLFLRFPEEEKNRIIALPGYLGGEFDVAGMKWVSSFPRNTGRGMDRASAVVVLNSPETGQPEALIEGSIISARRTAASAALAARALRRDDGSGRAGIVGCGLIGFEIARFLLAACPDVMTFDLYDTDAERARRFGEKCQELGAGVGATVVPDLNTLITRCNLVALATTAVKPHISDLSACAPGTTILHISLRDLTAEAILACDNVADDIDHVCRAQTSVHLAEQLTGNRDFIRCTLADVLVGAAPARRSEDSVVVFSPFGLGVLDLAVAKLVRDLAAEEKRGTVIESFLPEVWTERREPAAAAGAGN
jgi:ornithine cyclodeaminase